jgi:hypothetical protein
MRMKTITSVTAILGSAAAFYLPVAWADPDPRVPNGPADWCPGGVEPDGGGAKYCLGSPFPDGSFYGQLWTFGAMGVFRPGEWNSIATCQTWSYDSDGTRRIHFAPNSGCGGIYRVTPS